MVKKPLANAEDAGLIPGSGRSPGEGNGNPLQYCCLRTEEPRGLQSMWLQVGHDLVINNNNNNMSSVSRSFNFFPKFVTYTSVQNMYKLSINHCM